MSGLKKKGPSKRSAKKLRKAGAGPDMAIGTSRKRDKRGSIKTMFLDDY